MLPAITKNDLSLIYFFLLPAVALFLISYFTAYFQRKGFVKAYTKGEYDKALKKGLFFMKRLPPGRARQIMALDTAIIYLIKRDFYGFESQLNKVVSDRFLSLKFFWRTIAPLICDNTEEAERQYRLFTSTPKLMPKKAQPFEFYDTCLTAVFDFKSGDKSRAKEKLEQVYPKLKNPLLKEYYGGMLRELGSDLMKLFFKNA
jgi:hypothetical protein